MSSDPQELPKVSERREKRKATGWWEGGGGNAFTKLNADEHFGAWERRDESWAHAGGIHFDTTKPAEAEEQQTGSDSEDRAGPGRTGSAKASALLGE